MDNKTLDESIARAMDCDELELVHYLPYILQDFIEMGSSAEDIFEAWIINPAIRGIEKILNLFRWIQNGNTQHYILYGLVFLILITIWIMAAAK